MSDKSKKFFTKKNTVIVSVISILIIAAVIVFVSVKSDNNKKSSKDTSVSVSVSDTIENVEDETKNTDSSADTSNSDKKSSSDTMKDEETDSKILSDKNSSSNSDKDEIYSDDTNDSVTNGLPEERTIVEKTDEQNKWPKNDIPREIPECKYVSMDSCTMQEDDTSKAWFMSWVSKEADYNKWMSSITSSFKASETMLGRYANGKTVIDICTEDNGDGNLWVSLDIYQSDPIDFAAMPLNDCFPDFDAGDATLEYFVDIEDEAKVICQYTCATQWNELLYDYKQALAKAGYTVEDTRAYKNIAGKTYTVVYGGDDVTSDEMICFYY